MTEHSLNLQTLEKRLKKVEKQNRRFKLIGILLLAMAVIGGSLEAAMSQNTPLQQELIITKRIIAEGIYIVDKDNNTVASLETRDKQKVSIGGQEVVNKGGAMLLLTDKSNNNQISIGFNLGVAQILLADANSKTGNADNAILLSVSGGQPLISVMKNGQTFWQAPPKP